MSLFKSAVWFIKGIKEYTKGGYLAASKNFEPFDNISAKGRSFMITGANSGIGKETAQAIAAKGGTVHMVCRSEERGKKAQQEIIDKTGNSDVHLHILDISNIRGVKEFAADFSSKREQLNVLVNNAGAMVNQREFTSEGVEKNFAINTLGTYVLTTNLLPHMQEYDKPTVITVTSGGMLVSKLIPDDFNSERMTTFDGTMVYSQNKRQQVVMTDAWASKYQNVLFITMHPGWADTEAVRSSMPDFYRKFESRLRTAAEGADTLIWACLAPAARNVPSGSFLQDRQVVPKHLWLCSTHSSATEEETFMKHLDALARKVCY